MGREGGSEGARVKSREETERGGREREGGREGERGLLIMGAGCWPSSSSALSALACCNLSTYRNTQSTYINHTS